MNIIILKANFSMIDNESLIHQGRRWKPAINRRSEIYSPFSPSVEFFVRYPPSSILSAF